MDAGRRPSHSIGRFRKSVPFLSFVQNLPYGADMELRYAHVSTVK